MKKNKFFVGLFIVLLAFNLTGCKEQTTATTEQGIEDVTQIEFAELMKYKDSYVGDNSAVGRILYQLPANQYQNGFHLKTKEEPYEIVIRYEGMVDTADAKELFENNAIILFSLIQNVDLIKVEVEGSAQADDHVYSYSRTELESAYDVDLIELSSNEDSLTDFFNNKRR